MSTLRADSGATPQDYVRELRVGGHDVIEDQWRGEMDSITQVLLNNTVSMNPGLVVSEPVTLAGAETDITVGKAVGTLLGVMEFDADGLAVSNSTGWTPDVDQVANPGLIAVDGGVLVAGYAVVLYLAA